jgi:hypothetical protein
MLIIKYGFLRSEKILSAQRLSPKNATTIAAPITDFIALFLSAYYFQVKNTRATSGWSLLSRRCPITGLTLKLFTDGRMARYFTSFTTIFQRHQHVRLDVDSKNHDAQMAPHMPASAPPPTPLP